MSHKRHRDSFDDDLQSRYLKACDIEGDQPCNWTISDIDRRPVGLDGELKRCLTFVEHDKPLPLNVTNIRSLRELFGPDPDTVKGKVVQLVNVTTEFNGKSENPSWKRWSAVSAAGDTKATDERFHGPKEIL